MSFLRAILSSAFVFIFLSVTHARETERVYLSGRGKDDAVPWRFFLTAGPQSGYWTNLPVPSNWELHGFGTLSYRNEPTNAIAEQGQYEHEFVTPPGWSGRRVFLVFDGVMTDARVAVNGQSAGPDHQGAFYRFKYEITRQLKFGNTNLLSVLVHKRSLNESVNRAERQGDYWFFGGIFRPVYLEVQPVQFIERVAINARADGTFAMDVFVDGALSGDSIEAQVRELAGDPVGTVINSTRLQPENGVASVSLRTRIASCRLWSAETPNLYRVEVLLKRRGEVIHRFTQRFGFRTFEVRDGDGLYLNGQRVILKGANRHSFWPDSGRCLSEAVHRMDIDVLKSMNMNAVRMSHYPPDEQFLDLCDELGLYVLDELAGWHSSYDTPTAVRLIKSMVQRDVNHPSILFWDNGNEGGWNTDADEEFAKWDPQRRRVLHPWTTFNGVNTAHYLNYQRAIPAVAGRPNFRGSDGRDAAASTNAQPFIYMPTEFLHALYDGGAGAGLEDAWALMSTSKYLGGGFIWALVDEGVKRADTGKVDVAGNFAPDGIVGPYREREGSFNAIKEIWSPITVVRSGAGAENNGLNFIATNRISLELENHYSFTDANQLRFWFELTRFKAPMESPAVSGVAAMMEAPAPSIAPGSRGRLTLNLPPGWQRFDALQLRVSDPAQTEICRWVWPLPGIDRFRNAIDSPASNAVNVVESAEFISVRAGEFSMRIDRNTGLLAGFAHGDKRFSLDTGPRPAIGDAKLVKLEHERNGADAVVKARFEGALKSVEWRIRPNGWVRCEYLYAATGPQEFIGVLFDYPEAFVVRKRWLGNGPGRVWKNRLRGVTLGLWENDYNNTITGWRDWEYPEFKGCFGGVRWMQLETREGLLTIVPGRSDAFVQVLTPELPPTNLLARTTYKLPQAGLGLLEKIPPIGNKFHSAADTGPQGQPTQAVGEYRGSVEFFLGDAPPQSAAGTL